MFALKRLPKQMLFVLSLTMMVACHKNDATPSPDNKISRLYHFSIFPGNEYAEEVLNGTRIKIRLSLAGINPVTHQRTIMWDTTIAQSSMKELFSREHHCRLEVAITASEQALKHVVANYNVILEYKGVITNRSGAANQQHFEKDIPVEI
jgi:hypothetical protein